jgi:hypothetical protein
MLSTFFQRSPVKTFISACPAKLLLVFSSREKEPQPADSVPETTASCTMSYPTAGSRDNGVTYNQNSILSISYLDANGLKVWCESAGGNNDTRFTVPQATLTTNMQGTYELQPWLAQVEKPSPRAVSTASMRPAACSGVPIAVPTQDSLTIILYDGTQHLISSTLKCASITLRA